MCTGLEIAAFTALLGTGISAAGQIQQGKTQQAIDERNAKALNYQASDAIARGAQEEQTQRDRVRHIIAAQTVAAGASGADVGSKSFGDVMTQTAGLGEFDAQQIRLNALRSAWGLKTQAEGMKWQGAQAVKAGYLGAAGTALTGFGTAYSKLK